MSFKETFTVTGENLLRKIKELIAEGNVTKISIADKNGNEIISFPVTIGVIGAIFAPVIAAVGAVAALLTECKVTVERKNPPTDKDTEATDTGQTNERNGQAFGKPKKTCLSSDKQVFLVPSAGVEPAHPKILVFETNASTNSASWASCFVVRRCKYKSSRSVCKNIFACFVKLLCMKRKNIKASKSQPE